VSEDPIISPLADDENLVAYLDGELAGPQREQLEQRLVDDSRLRLRLRELQAGWELLEWLPDAPPKRDLVESTMEMAVIDVSRQFQTSDLVSPSTATSARKLRNPWSRSTIGKCLTLLLVGAIAGASLGGWKRYQESQIERENLVLAMDLEAYLHGGDLELIRSLPQQPQWESWVRLSRPTDLESPHSQPISALSNNSEDLLGRVQTMSSQERSSLTSNLARVERLDQERRMLLDSVLATLNQQTDRDQLLQTMRLYGRFRESLTPKQRDAIEKKILQPADREARDAAVEAALTTSIQELTRNSGNALDDDSVAVIYQAAVDILHQRLASNDPTVTLVYRTMKRLTRQEDPDWAVLRRLFVEPPSSYRRNESQGSFPAMAKVFMTNQELDQVFLMLPEPAADRLQSMSLGDAFWNRQILVYWIEEAIRRQSPSNDRRNASQRYAELPDDVRNEVDLLPPDEFFRILSGSNIGPPTP
jgi:hypothetical protein